MIYGYLLPVIFLLGFGSVFRGGEPPLLGQMGQILTITILGSTCLGLPTALVAERERGLWRLFRLLPVPTGALLVNVLLVRVVIVALSVLLQVVLARIVYGTPWPAHPGVLALGFLSATFAFLGLGVVITALARDVPSVQALGQCLFLPMILIGGVGVPLAVLPEWARVLASFLPGRYAVEVLQVGYVPAGSINQVGFAFSALFFIGLGAIFGGLKILRWDEAVRVRGRNLVWIGVALLGWVAVGLVAVNRERIDPVVMGERWSPEAVTEADMASISFEGLPEDNGIYTPLAPPLGDRRQTPRMLEFRPRLADWRPGLKGDPGQRVRSLLAVAAVADIGQDPAEWEIARAVFDQMRATVPASDLPRILAWIILRPDAGHVPTVIPELGLSQETDAGIVRERSDWYARKFLGRLLGKIEEPDPDSPE